MCTCTRMFWLILLHTLSVTCNISKFIAFEIMILFLQLPPNRSENNIMTNSVESYLIHQMLSAYVQVWSCRHQIKDDLSITFFRDIQLNRSHFMYSDLSKINIKIH